MTDSPSEELDTFQHTHAADGHQLQTAGFLDAAEPACPDCGLHVGGLKLPYQHHRDCPQYAPHPNSIAAQGS
jgi:hypothetical protein